MRAICEQCAFKDDACVYVKSAKSKWCSDVRNSDIGYDEAVSRTLEFMAKMPPAYIEAYKEYMKLEEQ